MQLFTESKFLMRVAVVLVVVHSVASTQLIMCTKCSTEMQWQNEEGKRKKDAGVC